MRRPSAASSAAPVANTPGLASSDTAPSLAPLGTAILVVGTLTMLLGTADVWLGWHDPFSWMMATVGLAVFIDVLCLKIVLPRR